MMARIDFKVAMKEIHNPNFKSFLDAIEKSIGVSKEFKNIARDEQPFVPELAWAYFSAYTTIIAGSNIQFITLKSGLEGADKLLTDESVKKIIKAALPHQAKFIDEHPQETYFFLLEEIEQKLLVELRKIVEGREADKAAAQHAKDIMIAVAQADAARAENVVS
jgi:hypothetical protein